MHAGRIPLQAMARVVVWFFFGLFGLWLGGFGAMTSLARAEFQFDPPVNLSNNPTSSLAPDVAAAGSNVYVVWYDRILGPSGIPDIFFRRSTDEGKTFEDAVNLSHNAGGSLLPRVAAVGSDVYAVWEDDTGTPGVLEILFRRSHDGGLTWEPALGTTPLNLSATPARNSANPAIAVAGPEVYVIWEETLGGTATAPETVVIRFRRSIDQGKTFGPPIDLSLAVDGDSFNPTVAATGSAVYVAWNNQHKPPTAILPQVFFLSSLDEGASWDTPAVQNVSQSSGTATNPSLAAAGAAVFISWQDDRENPGVPDIFYNLSVNQGSTFRFSAGSLGNNISNTPSAPSVEPRTASAGSTFAFIWQDRSPGNFELFFSPHILSGTGLTTFLPIQKLTTTSGNARLPGIAMTGSKVYVVWEQDPLPGSTSGAEIVFMRSTPADGVAAENLSVTPGRPSITPSVAVDGQDVYVTWGETGVALQLDVLFRASPDGGRTFTPPLNLSHNPGQSSNPKVAASGQVVYVVWEDDTDTPGVPDIFFRRSLSRGSTWDPPLDKPPMNLSQFGFPTDNSRSPTIAVQGGELYVAWEDDTKGDKTIDSPQIFFRRSLNAALPGTPEWLPPLDAQPEQLSCPGAKECKGFMPSLAAAGSNVYLSWQLDLLGTRSIQFDTSFDQTAPHGSGGTAAGGCGGASLDKDVPFGPVPSNPQAAAAGSSAYVVWLKGEEIYFRAARVSGTACLWEPALDLPPAHLSFDFKASHAPVIAAAGEGVYVAWSEDILTGSGTLPPDIRFVRSLDQGITFELPTGFLVESPGSSEAPSLAAAGPEVYLVWQENTPGNFADEVFLRSSTDQGAAFPLPILPGASNCQGAPFRSADYFLLHINTLPHGMVFIGGVNFNNPISTANRNQLYLALGGNLGFFQSLGPWQQLNREFVTVQMSLLSPCGPMVSSVGILKSILSCFGGALENFAPVILSNGFILSPGSTLGDLFDQARSAFRERRMVDMPVIAGLLKILNGNDP